MSHAIQNYLEPISQMQLFNRPERIKKALFGDTLTLNAQFPFLCEEQRIKTELEALHSKIVFKHQTETEKRASPNIKFVIAVASGKGGVGKSTVAVNLALAMQQQGAKVGILDADLYGPSQALMLGGAEKPRSPDNKKMYPIIRHGIQSLSIADLINGADEAMIWRGALVHQTLVQLWRETLWQDLDYLILDLPPGTGDTQLTLAQQIPVSGAMIVTTPQEIALADARKAKTMFDKVNIPILGLVENMSHFCCENCGHLTPIFGTDGGKALAERYGVPLLGQIPLNIKIREDADKGQPTVIADPESPLTRIYQMIAFRTMAILANQTLSAPKIVIK